MKKLLFLSFLLTASVEAKQIILDIPDDDIKIVETRIVDFEKWVRELAANKISNTKEWVINEEIKYCLENGKTLPNTQEAIIKSFLKRLGLRKDREK